jgi:hypothetical protein
LNSQRAVGEDGKVDEERRRIMKKIREIVAISMLTSIRWSLG